MCLTALLATVAISQLTFAPWLLPALQRAPDRPWHLFTAPFAQDGGVEGTVFNLVGMLLVGTLAEQWWPRPLWLAFAVLGGLAGNVAGVWLQPYGAGNSVLVFGLAATLSVVRPCWPAWAAYVTLIALGDLHGFAALPGLLAWRLRARVLP